MIKVITSKDNARVKFALSLKDNKVRKEHHQFLAETYKSLSMALENDLVEEVFTTEWLDLKEDIKQNLVSDDILRRLSSNVNPEGVVFIAHYPDYSNLNFNKILYLDNVSDPGNMGTLIRTALAFSYDAVIVSQGSCSIYNEKVINSTKGAIFSIPVFVGDISCYVDSHEIIVSTLSSDSVSLESITFKDKFVLVLGNESHGVSPKINNISHKKVKIEISNIDSLNVAVAGGILMNKIH